MCTKCVRITRLDSVIVNLIAKVIQGIFDIDNFFLLEMPVEHILYVMYVHTLSQESVSVFLAFDKNVIHLIWTMGGNTYT